MSAENFGRIGSALHIELAQEIGVLERPARIPQKSGSLRWVAVFATMFSITANPQALGQTMALPGQLDINAIGAAEYRIPIGTPPGTGGMVPELTLDYSSQRGDGIVGVGWTLSGLPSIGRCAKNPAQDGADGRVTYGANDRFCLQGQRLVGISGTYGADGAEYRTELEGYSRIISHGVAGTGPAWFEIKTKSGQTLQLGNTTDSRVLAQGTTTARAWSVNRITDTKGNYLTVTYTVDASNGQIYPNRIDYTGNAAAGLATYNSVQFTYETRLDVPILYHAGSVLVQNKRLINVKGYSGATLVSDYRLAYGQSSSSGVSRLTSVKLCDGVGICLPATTFGYSGTNYMAGGAMGYTVYTNPGTLNGQLSGFQPSFADFNDDGRQDIFWDKTDQYGRSIGMRELWLTNGTNSFQRIQNVNNLNGTWGTGVGTSTFERHVGDFNGDLKADVLWLQVGTTGLSNGTAAGSIVIWTSNGDGTFQVSNTTPATIAAGYEFTVGDLNGDGKSDIRALRASDGAVIYWINTSSGGAPTFQALTGTSGCKPDSSSGGGQNYRNRLADVLGEGRTAIVCYSATIVVSVGQYNLYTRIYSYRLSEAGVIENTTYTNLCGATPPGSASCPYHNDVFPTVADFNGDGKEDLFLQGLDWRTLWMSTGKWVAGTSGNFQTNATTTPGGAYRIFLNVNGQNGQSTYYVPRIFDFNADGKADVMFSNPGNTSRYLWLSKGDGTFTIVTNVANRNGVNPGGAAFVVDLNGDGKAEVFWDTHDAYGRSNGTRELWWSDMVPADVLTTITGGLGDVTTITYTPLTVGAPVYVKDTNAVYPTVDLQGPMYVVSRVDTADGIGGNYSVSYSYAGAKADQSGRGFLGFRQRVKTDLRTNVVETTDYRQDFPYLSVIAAERKRLGNQLLNETVNTYSATNLGGTRHFVGVSQSVTGSWDLDGTALPTTATTYQYDGFGNPTQIAVTGSDGTVRTTTNTYTNDTVNWYLGRLTGASVTNTVP